MHSCSVCLIVWHAMLGSCNKAWFARQVLPRQSAVHSWRTDLNELCAYHQWEWCCSISTRDGHGSKWGKIINNRLKDYPVLPGGLGVGGWGVRGLESSRQGGQGKLECDRTCTIHKSYQTPNLKDTWCDSTELINNIIIICLLLLITNHLMLMSELLYWLNLLNRYGYWSKIHCTLLAQSIFFKKQFVDLTK